MADALAVILAAGRAARLKTDLPKPLHRVCGRALLDYALDAALGSGVSEVVVLAPPEADALFPPGLGGWGGRARCITAAGGPAQGIAQALSGRPAGDVLFLPCDLPQLEARHLSGILEAHRASGASASALLVAGARTGVFAAGPDAIANIAPDATPEALFPGARPVDLPGPALIDVNTRADLARAEKALRRAVAERLMDEGVTLIDPENTYVGAGVRIGIDTVVYPWTILEGDTVIGRRCAIGPNAHLLDTVVGDDVAIQMATVRESRLRDRVRVGPFANLRPGCDIGEDTKIGDFVEMKNARVGAGVSAAHLTYVGDAEVGDGANIGAGVITCNYDGVRKNRTTIGAGAFVGSNSVLIAPVTVGPGAYVAAHSSITQDVPADALGIARSRQENKEGWAARRRQNQRKD